MAHNHWPVGPEPQLRITSVCYSWCQSDGRGCPTRSREWGHAHRYGSGAHAEYSSGTAVLDSRWDGNGYKDGGQHSFAGKGFRSARKVSGEPSRRDHQQRAGRFVGKSTASNTGGGGTAVHTNKTSDEQQELFARAMQQWQSENTRLYFLVKDSVLISGDWEALDRETIKERFTSGRLRDGVAFVKWVNSYHDHTTEEGQIALNAEFKRTMVLKPDGAGGSLASMRKRWLEGYSVWKKLADSDESDRVKLEVYYKAMVNSLPSSPIEHPLVRVRMWLSEKLHERSSMFDSMESAVSGTLRFAEAMGIRHHEEDRASPPPLQRHAAHGQPAAGRDTHQMLRGPRAGH